MTEQKAFRLRIFLAFAAIYIIWGSTYLAIRFAIETMPPILMAGVRFFISGGAIYLLARWFGASKPEPVNWKWAAVIGILMIIGGTGTVTWAEQLVPSGLTALMIAAVPFWIVLIEWLRRDGVRPSKKTIAGLIIGFAGILILIDPANIGSGEQINLIGAFALILAALSWAIGSVYTRFVKLPTNKVISSSMQTMIGGFVMILLGIALGETSQVQIDAISFRSVAALIYLITFGGVAFIAYTWLLTASTPERASTYAFVNPVVAIILGSALAGEEFTLRIFIASIVIIGAVTIITFEKAKSSTKTAQQKTAPLPRAVALPECD